MKNFTMPAAILVAGGLMLFSHNALTKVNGAPAGHSGSPGDNNKTCTECHSGASISTQTISIDVKKNGNTVTEYDPGETYQVEVELALNGAGNPVGGFQAAVESASGVKIGTILVTDGARTQKVSGNITHTSSGTTFSGGSLSYSFDWQAPTTGVGPVTVYVAANFANGNGTQLGDAIGTNQLTINQSNLSTPEFTRSDLVIYPNPAEDRVEIKFDVTDPMAEVQVFDLTGKMLISESHPAGSGKVEVGVEDLSTGHYLVRVLNGNTIHQATLLKR